MLTLPCPRLGQSNILFLDLNPGRDAKKQLDPIVPRAASSRDSSLDPITKIPGAVLVPIYPETQTSNSFSVKWINPYPPSLFVCLFWTKWTRVSFCLLQPNNLPDTGTHLYEGGSRQWTGPGRPKAQGETPWEEGKRHWERKREAPMAPSFFRILPRGDPGW